MTGWWIVAFMIMAGLVVGQTVLSVVMFRLLGVVLLRMGPNYARAFTELSWGNEVPVESLKTMDGREVALRSSRRTLLVFVSPACSVCRYVGPALEALVPLYHSTTDFVAIIDGDRQMAMKWAKSNSTRDIAVVAGTEQPKILTKDISPPYGILVESGKVFAHGVTNDREMIDSLLTSTESNGHEPDSDRLLSLAQRSSEEVKP